MCRGVGEGGWEEQSVQLREAHMKLLGMRL